jgi:predicted amino acid-binding ACT domain protein
MWQLSTLAESRCPVAFEISRSSYYYLTVEDRPGEAYRILSRLAQLGVNLLAFTGVPIGPQRTQLSVFPADPNRLLAATKSAGITADGPYPAFLIQGDDELGALADVHERLYNARVNVYASSGVTDGRGAFGYVLYVRPERYEEAAAALGL